MKNINFEIKDFQKYQSLNTLIMEDNGDEDCNQPLNNLPVSLEWLDIKSKVFNQPLDNLPSFNLEKSKNALETLTLSETYNLPLNNVPTSVKIIRIKYY